MPRRWTLKTNRHPNTDGSPWGWVEADGTYGRPLAHWSGAHERQEQQKLVDAHNVSLEGAPDA